MEKIGEKMNGIDSCFGMLTLLSSSVKTCQKHGIEYTEEVYRPFTRGCPECSREREEARRLKEQEDRQAEYERRRQALISQRIGKSKIPTRFQEKKIADYKITNDKQKRIVDIMSAYAREFNELKHSGRCLALLGNAGTGKTHLACAIGRHVMVNCDGTARFTSVSEINRIVREAKSFNSEHTETEIIEAFGAFDVLIIDEVGVQSGTDAESRALFDVFNERYQNCKPTILISNLDIAGFRAAVGDRIADRVKEDGGEVLIFDWESSRG